MYTKALSGYAVRDSEHFVGFPCAVHFGFIITINIFLCQILFAISRIFDVFSALYNSFTHTPFMC